MTPATSSAKRSGRPIRRVAWYTTSPHDHALSVMRVSGPLAQAGIEILAGSVGAGSDVECIARADLVLLQRDFPRAQGDYEKVMERAREAGKPVVYEIDDLLLELPADHPDRATHYYAPALMAMLRAALEADAILTSTRPLREQYRRINPNTWLFPNLLNHEAWPQRVLQPVAPHAPLVIGYFGSGTHAPDLEAIAPALERVLSRYGARIQFRFWGCPPPQRLRGDARVSWSALHLPRYVEYAAFVQAQSVDIGLAPLRDTVFNRAKSPIKFLEYSAAGIPAVCSALPPYAALVREGRNGLLAGSLEAWEEALSALINDDALRARIREQAHAAAYSRWALSGHPNLWRETVVQAVQASRRAAGPDPARTRMVASLARQIHAWQLDMQGRVADSQEQAAELAEAREQSLGERRASEEAARALQSEREKTARLETSARRIPELEAAVATAAREMDALRVAHDRAQAELAARALEITAAKDELTSRERALSALHQETEKEKQMVQALSGELLALKASTGYGLLRALWRIRLWLAPHGSRREAALRMGVRGFRGARREGLWAAYRLMRPVVRAVLPEKWRLRLGDRMRRAIGPGRMRPEVLRGRTISESGGAQPFGAPTSYDVLCFPIIEWGHRFQRPQQLAMQFAEHGHRVFYLEMKFHDQGPEVLWRETAPGVFQIQLPGPVNHNRFLEPLPEEMQRTGLAALERFCEQAVLLDAVCLVELPMWTPLALGLRERYGWKLVYDCMDEHSGLTILRPEMLADEDRLAREADLVLVSSAKLREKHAAHAARLLPLPNAADFEHFNHAARGRELRRMPRPIIGYYGAIMGWFDAELVEAAARARPQWSFVLIGNVDTDSVAALRGLANVHFLGEKPYSRLPAYLSQFDVCLIPFRRTPIIESTDPVKFYEYLSAGKPVVSVPLPELARKPGLFYPARTGVEVVAQVERALAENSPARAAERVAWARSQTWQNRYHSMRTAIDDLHGLASLIIVSYNSLDNVRACLENILRETHYPRFEVIVVDNGSPREVVRYLKGVAQREPRVRVILNDANLGFARANNLGLEAISEASQAIVLLNNDTVVTRGWLTRLMYWLRDPQVGLVGPVTSPGGVFNQAAVPVSYRDLGQMAAAAEAYTRAHLGQSFDIPMLAMYCMAMRRDTFRALGPLDERFGVGMFEDDDYSLRARRAGYRVICVEDVFVHHAARSSFSQLEQAAYQKLFEENRRYFESKWKTTWQPPIGRE